MLRGLIVVAIAGLVMATAGSASAADRAFTVRFSANDTGDIAMAANTLLTCPAPAAGCAAAQGGAADNNNNYTMGYVDVDSDGSTFDSSTADLTLPAGATVLFAGLYWGGDTSAGTSGAAAPSAAARGSVLMQVPGGSYAAVSATSLDDSTAQASRYQGFADVTAAVAAAGSGTYAVANVQAGTGQDRYAGWALVVAYHDQAQTPRNLTVFDGLRTVSSATPALDIPVSGFFTPVSGTVNTTLGFIAWEGDRGLLGDTASLNATALSDAANPATNFFNSSIAKLGTNVTTKSPDYVNQLAFDADLLDASGILPNGASSATIHLSTVGDTYLPGMVSFATDLYSPRLLPGKSAVDLNGGAVVQGDVIEYSITATNTGQDGASDVVVTDPIPAHTSYVPGSLRIVTSPGGIAGAKTDAAGDDQAEETGSGVTFRLGAGATSASGGTIEPGESYEVRFQVRIDTPTAAGTVIVNRAKGTYSAETHPTLELTDISLPTQLSVVAPDLVIAKTDSGGFVRGSTGSFTLAVSNTGSGPTTGVVTVTDSVPSSLHVTGASGAGWSCGVAGQTVTCTRADALAAGGAYPDITVDVSVAQSAGASVSNTAQVAGGGDSDTSNNDGSDTVSVSSSADLAITKSVRPAAPVAGRHATFTLVATNIGPSNATGVTVTDPLPAQLTGATVSTTAGSCALLAGTVTCTIPNLASGASATVTIRGLVDPSSTGATLANTAGISGNEPDPDASNDSDSVSPVIVGEADLGVVKTMSPSDPIAGGPVSFRIAVSNHGPSDATGVAVSDPLPAQITAPTVSASQGSCTVLAGTVSCALGTLAPGGSASVVVSGTIAAGSSGQTVVNTAQVQGNETDPDLSNNIANTSGRIEATRLRVGKTASAGSVRAGSTVRYTISVKVTGPAAATDVDACDRLPPHTSFVNVDGATLTAGAACWHFASIAAGATETRNVVVRVDSDAPTGTLRNLLVVHAGNAAPRTDGATVGVQAAPPASIPAVTG